MDNRLDQSEFDNDADAPSRYSHDQGGQMGETSGVSREPSYIEPGESNHERTYGDLTQRSNAYGGEKQQYGGEGDQYKQGRNFNEQDPDALQRSAPGEISNNSGAMQNVDEVNPVDDAVNGNGNGNGYGQEKFFQRPQGEEEYPGRSAAHVVPHDAYLRETGGHGEYGGPQQNYSAQTAGQGYPGQASEQVELEQAGEHDLGHEQYQEQGQGLEDGQDYAGVGAIGGAGNSARGTSSYQREGLQPSRSYLEHPSRPQTISAQPTDGPYGQEKMQQQGGYGQEKMPEGVYGQEKLQNGAYGQEVAQEQPVVNEMYPNEKGLQQRQTLNGDQATIRKQPSMAGTQRTQLTQNQQMMPQQQNQLIEGGSGAVAVGTGYQGSEAPQMVQQDAIGSGQSMLSNGPHTGVQPLNTITDGQFSPTRQIAGGGLGAALATSGHNLTKTDKKALKSEIKTEKKFEKTLASDAKSEAIEIAGAVKLAKESHKKAQKSAAYEVGFRTTYEKAIKKEVRAKQHLLKITNEYNKIAADLERATKEMEIRRNLHLADLQTRDADDQKVEDLRKMKGAHDMEREARHGDSLTKQAQAKRALSMSSKRKSAV